MSVFDLAGNSAFEAEARDTGIRSDQVQPGFFDGLATATGQGIMRGGAKAVRGLGLAAAGAAQLATSVVEGRSLNDPNLDTTVSDKIFAGIDEYVNPAIEYWTPDAKDVGTVGRVMGGLAEIVLPLAAGGGNPIPLIASTGLNTPADLTRQGVDATTAIGVGLVDATAVGVGFRLPFLGSTFAKKAATGAAGGVALGTVATALDQSVLEAGGYEDIAERYDPLDVEARTVDLLTGIAFGGVAQLQARGAARIQRSDRDAALAGLNAQHFQSETAPGIPRDQSAVIAHQRAIEEALTALQEGRPVDVGRSGVTDAGFIDRPAPASTDIRGELSELGIRDTDDAIQARFDERLRSDPDSVRAEYAALPDSGGGKILNTDIARELSPDYLADRTRSAAVHEPASRTVKELYEQMLTEPPKAGEQPLVVLSAGGTGAGKTTGLQLTGVDRVAQIVYDTNMNSMASSVKKIEQALAAGKGVQILYTFRDPVESLTGGALPRAMRQEKQFGTGRTVPIREHAKTHIGASKVVRELAAKYKDNPNVSIKVVDNSLGKGQAKDADLTVVPKVELEQTELVRRLNDALDTEFKADRISEAIYRGFKGELRPEEVRSGSVRESTSEGSGRADQPPKSGEAVDPDVAAARQLLEESDLEIPTGAVDADGNPTFASARELMAQADAEVAQAAKDGKGYEAAVSCLLSFGAA